MQFPMIGSDVVLKIGSLPVPSQIKGVTDVAQSTSEQPSTEVKLETTDRGMRYGTRLQLAKKIMSDPERPVLFFNQQDKNMAKQLFIGFYKRG